LKPYTSFHSLNTSGCGSPFFKISARVIDGGPVIVPISLNSLTDEETDGESILYVEEAITKKPDSTI
jgi:hypothetical protein